MNATPPSTARRGLALLLTALGPGFGHLYARDYRRALQAPFWWLLASAVPGLLAPFIPALARWILPLSAAWMLAIWWAIALHAALQVGHHPRARSRPLELAFLGIWLAMWGGQAWIRHHIGGPVATRGQSMAPSIGAGELFYVSRIPRMPQRGQVVLFNSEGRERLGRVLGVPGDRVGLRQGVLVRDGVVVGSEGPELQWWAAGCARTTQPLLVEEHGAARVPIVTDAESGSGEERLLGPAELLVHPDDRRGLQTLPEPIPTSEVTGVVSGVLPWTNPCGVPPLRALWAL